MQNFNEIYCMYISRVGSSEVKSRHVFKLWSTTCFALDTTLEILTWTKANFHSSVVCYPHSLHIILLKAAGVCGTDSVITWCITQPYRNCFPWLQLILSQSFSIYLHTASIYFYLLLLSLLFIFIFILFLCAYHFSSKELKIAYMILLPLLILSSQWPCKIGQAERQWLAKGHTVSFVTVRIWTQLSKKSKHSNDAYTILLHIKI